MSAWDKFNACSGGNVLHPIFYGDSVHVICRKKKQSKAELNLKNMWTVSIFVTANLQIRTIQWRNDVGHINKSINWFRPQTGIARARYGTAYIRAGNITIPEWQSSRGSQSWCERKTFIWVQDIEMIFNQYHSISFTSYLLLLTSRIWSITFISSRSGISSVYKSRRERLNSHPLVSKISKM